MGSIKLSSVPYAGPNSVKNAFTNRDTHPLVFSIALLQEFGTSYLEWEPVTLWAEISSTWGTTTADSNKHKIQAVRTCQVSPQAYERWEVFEKVASGLFGLPPMFDVMQKVTSYRAAVAVDIMTSIEESAVVGADVWKYTAAALLDEGVVYAPPPIEGANPHIARIAGLSLQEKVKERVNSGRLPEFDNEVDLDVQTMKSIAIVDFVQGTDKILVEQMNRLFP